MPTLLGKSRSASNFDHGGVTDITTFPCFVRLAAVTNFSQLLSSRAWLTASHIGEGKGSWWRGEGCDLPGWVCLKLVHLVFCEVPGFDCGRLHGAFADFCKVFVRFRRPFFCEKCLIRQYLGSGQEGGN